MGPGMGIQRRKHVAPREDCIFEGEGMNVTRLSRDRYRYRDAYTENIRSGAEIDALMRQQATDALRRITQLNNGRRMLSEARAHQDGQLAPELVRKVDVAPTLRAVPTPPPVEAPVAPAVSTAASDEPERPRVFRAPPKRTRKPKTPKAVPPPESVVAQEALGDDVPEKIDAPVKEEPPARKRRAYGTTYLNQLRAQAGDGSLQAFVS